MNDWTLFESGMIFGIFCLILLAGCAVYGIAMFVRWLYAAIQSEIRYRYYFREVRNPRKYAKRSRDKKEPMWDIILKVFGIDKTEFIF